MADDDEGSQDIYSAGAQHWTNPVRSILSEQSPLSDGTILVDDQSEVERELQHDVPNTSVFRRARPGSSQDSGSRSATPSRKRPAEPSSSTRPPSGVVKRKPSADTPKSSIPEPTLEEQFEKLYNARVAEDEVHAEARRRADLELARRAVEQAVQEKLDNLSQKNHSLVSELSVAHDELRTNKIMHNEVLTETRSLAQHCEAEENQAMLTSQNLRTELFQQHSSSIQISTKLQRPENAQSTILTEAKDARREADVETAKLMSELVESRDHLRTQADKFSRAELHAEGIHSDVVDELRSECEQFKVCSMSQQNNIVSACPQCPPKDVQISELRSKQLLLETKLTESAQRSSDLEHQNSGLEHSVATIKISRDELTQKLQLADLAMKRDQNVIHELGSSLDVVKVEAKAKIAEMDAEISSAKRQAQDKATLISELGSKISYLESQISSNKSSSSNNHDVMLVELRTKLGVSEERIQDLKEMNQHLKNQVGSLVEDNNKLQKQVSDLISTWNNDVEEYNDDEDDEYDEVDQFDSASYVPSCHDSFTYTSHTHHTNTPSVLARALSLARRPRRQHPQQPKVRANTPNPRRGRARAMVGAVEAVVVVLVKIRVAAVTKAPTDQKTDEVETVRTNKILRINFQSPPDLPAMIHLMVMIRTPVPMMHEVPQPLLRLSRQCKTRIRTRRVRKRRQTKSRSQHSLKLLRITSPGWTASLLRCRVQRLTKRQSSLGSSESKRMMPRSSNLSIPVTKSQSMPRFDRRSLPEQLATSANIATLSMNSKAKPKSFA